MQLTRVFQVSVATTAKWWVCHRLRFHRLATMATSRLAFGQLPRHAAANENFIDCSFFTMVVRTICIRTNVKMATQVEALPVAKSVDITVVVPCCNNASTLLGTLNSLLLLPTTFDRKLVIDDRSQSRRRKLRSKLDLRSFAFSENIGRGAVRARGVEECQSTFLLSCGCNSRNRL